MNAQQRWHYIQNHREIIQQHMDMHDEEVRTRKLVKFLEGSDIGNVEDMVIQLHDIARKIEKQIGVGLLSSDIRNCADRLSAMIKHPAWKRSHDDQ